MQESLEKDRGDWERWACTDNPHEEQLPGDWQTKLTDFEKIVLLKAFRPEKLLYANVNYVKNNMGSEYTEAPSTTMDTVYRDMDEKTPLIFILSTGADPTQQLQKFA